MQTGSMRSALMRGSLWMVGARWAGRSIGLLSTLVLARVLVPADFGLVAMAWVLIGLLDVCSSFGLDYALIRNTEATRRHFDTAWTLRLIQSASVALIAALAAPLMARYFDEPRVAPLIQALAVSVLLGGLTNIGSVLFRRDLDFAREFWFGLAGRLVSSGVTVVLAWLTHSYWALALGTLAGALANVGLSYLMHPYRPRWCLNASRELWGFSQWMLWVNVGAYAQERADQLIVGHLTSPREMGLYNVSGELANLPTSEVLYPLSRVLFPGFAKLAVQPDRLREAYYQVVGFLSTLALPAGVGLALVASEFVRVVLGPQWTEAVPLLQGLALAGVFRTVCGQAGNVLLVLGRPGLVAALTWANVALMVPAVFFAGQQAGMLGMVWAKLACCAVIGLAQVIALQQVFAMRLTRTVAVLWRPAAACLVMGGVVTAWADTTLIASLPLALHLLANITLGAISYTGALLTLWWVAGCPKGTESLLLDLLLSRLPAQKAGSISLRV